MNEQDNFEKIYPVIRSTYEDLVYKENISPMQIFGVFLGIIAQEFRQHSSKEKFDEFLETMKNHKWDERSVQ
jgi:hypothetical protein